MQRVHHPYRKGLFCRTSRRSNWPSRFLSGVVGFTDERVLVVDVVLFGVAEVATVLYRVVVHVCVLGRKKQNRYLVYDKTEFSSLEARRMFYLQRFGNEYESVRKPGDIYY